MRLSTHLQLAVDGQVLAAAAAEVEVSQVLYEATLVVFQDLL